MTSPLFSIILILPFIIPTVGSEDAGMDLLGVLQLHNTSREGVTLTPGPHRLRPAFYLQGNYRDLKLPEAGYKRAVELLHDTAEFTLSASVRQEQFNSGTIIAFSHGVNRYLEVQSSGRKDELRLHYTSRWDRSVRVETFPYRLADRRWHKVALSVTGSQVILHLDCHPLYTRLLQAPLDTNFTLPQLSLWVGQRNNRHSLFKGALQDVRIIKGAHGYLNQCPHLDTACPTCGQFNLLQDTIHQLTNTLKQLSSRLESAEGRIAKVEECDCQKSCSVNGSIHSDGATWQHQCQICSCVHGSVECRPVQCPKIDCKKPVINPGDCCPTCLKQCYLRGTLYDHGDLVSLKQCVECECRDGSMHCTRIDPETMCPPLLCPHHQQFSVPDECCKFCPGVDYCGKGHTCHMNASCLNLETTYACHCDAGFTGDGHNCVDIDECLSEGGLEGHHCRSNTRCQNTPGGYECQCLPGHRTIDRFSCMEIDECATDVHKCDEHALCINTQGSYHCQCLQGYTGDGYHCQPICEEPCENGGWCVDGGVCQCRAGYDGSSCQLDVDECSAGLHNCDNTSRCVNMPGWYYCTCAQGYASVVTLHSSHAVTVCQDVDECENGNHTCHPSAECVNTQGGFRCSCDHQSSNTTECKLSCMMGEVEVEDGGRISRSDCQECKCNAGVLNCTRKECDCEAATKSPDLKCCPQCDPALSCTHQELSHLTFRSGEQWIYQCQTCECLLGEIDCWEVECAPVWCETTVLGTTDCCPRCASEDPCAPGGNLSSGPRPCAPHPLSPAAHWTDDCPTCNCKEPFCELLVSNMAFCVHRMDSCVAVLISAVVILLNNSKCRLERASTILLLHALFKIRHHFPTITTINNTNNAPPR